MRRVLIFFSSFALVLVAGVALGAMGGDGPDYDSAVSEGGPLSVAGSEIAESPDRPPALEKEDSPLEKPAAEEAISTKARTETPKPVSAEPEKETPEEAAPADEQPAAVEKETPPADEETPSADEVPTPPADTTPPAFVILHPVSGQVFETEKAVFEGEVEPGARVFAGPYEADVNVHGGWRIVLFLEPGENRAKLRAVDVAGNESFDSVNVVYQPPAPPTTHPEERPEELAGEFSANQLYGSCGENPPYDVFYGHGIPGDTIEVVSEYGSAATTVGPHGEWEVRVEFPEAPVGKGFLVKVRDGGEHAKRFEFVRTGGDH